METEVFTQLGLMTLFLGSVFYRENFKSVHNIWKYTILREGLFTFHEALASCPSGYRLPTLEEYQSLCLETPFLFDNVTSEGIFTFSDGLELRMPVTKMPPNEATIGCRHAEQGVYWTSTPHGNGSYVMYFTQCLVQSTIICSQRRRFSVLYIRK